MHVSMYILHLVLTFTPHYVITDKGLLSSHVQVCHQSLVRGMEWNNGFKPLMANLDMAHFAWAHQRHRQCCICHTAPEGGTFVPCDTLYAPTHTISYLWHGRECCTQYIAFGTGSRANFCIQHSLPCYNYYI